MAIRYFRDLVQGSDEWLAARCGLLTASEVKHIISPIKLQYSKSDTHLYELAAQRITRYVEPAYISDDMLRGSDDEIEARQKYQDNYGLTVDVGFITNDKWGFTLGFSPDSLIGEDGFLEIKSRRQKFQIETIIEGQMPSDFLIQVQAGLLISERKFCDFISYCGGMHMATIRVEPDPRVQDAIIEAAKTFHVKLAVMMEEYQAKLIDPSMRLVATERRIEQEIV